MYCPRCGESNEEAARFCSACGLDLTTYQRLWTDTGAQASGQTGQPPQPDRGPGPYPGAAAYQGPQYRPIASYDPAQRVPSHLGFAIMALVLFFWPTGIPAVVYASQVNNKLVVGDIAGAEESSHKAKMWSWISLGIAVVILVLLLIGLGMGSIESNDLY